MNDDGGGAGHDAVLARINCVHFWAEGDLQESAQVLNPVGIKSRLICTKVRLDRVDPVVAVVVEAVAKGSAAPCPRRACARFGRGRFTRKCERLQIKRLPATADVYRSPA